MSSSYVPVESLLQSSAFRRLLGVSLVGHLLVYGFLVFRPSSNATLIAAAPVMVQMVDLPKGVPAPPPPAAKPPPPKPPEEKAKPPEPPPPKPVVKEIVIPKEPAPLPAKPKPKTPPPSAEELIAKMTQRVEQQEAANAPPAAAPSESPAAQPQAGLPSAGAFDPLLSPWIARVQVQVRANWSGATVCEGRTNPVFYVDVDASGHLSSIELSQSSGDRHCDDTGERALRKSDPLPPPPRPGQFELWLDAKVNP